MKENWGDIPGFEGRYQVSDLGRVKSLPFLQRYLLRNGKEAYRRTRERIRIPQFNNSGYAMVHLYLEDVAYPRLIHRLVAEAFVAGEGATVNHKDGVKSNNTAKNLEWASYSENHLHAVAMGLNTQARRVVINGIEYPSVTQAVKNTHLSRKAINRMLYQGAM